MANFQNKQLAFPSEKSMIKILNSNHISEEILFT